MKLLMVRDAQALNDSRLWCNLNESTIRSLNESTIRSLNESTIRSLNESIIRCLNEASFVA